MAIENKEQSQHSRHCHRQCILFHRSLDIGAHHCRRNNRKLRDQPKSVRCRHILGTKLSRYHRNADIPFRVTLLWSSRNLKAIRKPPNDSVDAAARIQSSIAGPFMMRNTLPPLASNDLLGIRYLFRRSLRTIAEYTSPSKSAGSKPTTITEVAGFTM